MGTGEILPQGTLPAVASGAVKRPSHPWLRGIALAACAIVLLPIVSLTYVALSGNGEDWPHLLRNVLPGASVTTLYLLAMVAALTSAAGVATAWMVGAYEFPLRRTLAWALVLPLAVPSYLAAYAFGEFFHFSGPVQGAVRAIFGFETVRDYWFPDIRTTPGCAFVLASVLYPYVYLTTRIVFLMQGRNIADVARTLGARPAKVFWRVLLPVARPAIIAGVALVMMETINDIGAAEYLGVHTLTFAVYTTWLNRGSLEGGAQIALLMLVLVFLILFAEQWARRRQRFHTGRATHMKVHPPRVRLGRATGTAGDGRRLAAGALRLRHTHLCFRPLRLAPAGAILIAQADRCVSEQPDDGRVHGGADGGAGAVPAQRGAPDTFARRGGDGAPGFGRATPCPAAYLGLGLLFALARFDNTLDAFARSHFDFSTGLLLTGSAAGVILACSIRFLALAEGAIRSGMEKLPGNLDEAARSLGRTPARERAHRASAAAVSRRSSPPRFWSSSTRSRNFRRRSCCGPSVSTTLATYVYENASRGVPQEGAAAAIVIILTALVPVMLLSGALARDREASL